MHPPLREARLPLLRPRTPDLARRPAGPRPSASRCWRSLLWAVSGPLFGFSDTWQLVINTGTTIVTFLMVFLIQNTQNRDTEAMQLKLDELIRATQGAHNALLDLEELDDERFAAVPAQLRASWPPRRATS